MLLLWRIIGLIAVYAIVFYFTRYDEEEMQWKLNYQSSNVLLLYRAVPIVFIFFLFTRQAFFKLFDWFQPFIYKAVEFLQHLTRMLTSIQLPRMVYILAELRTYIGYMLAAWYIASFGQSIYWSFYDIERTRYYIACVFVSGFLFLIAATGSLNQSVFHCIIGDFNSMFYAIAILSFSSLQALNTAAVVFIIETLNTVLEWVMLMTESYRGQIELPHLNGALPGIQHLEDLSFCRSILTFLRSLLPYLAIVFNPIRRHQIRMTNMRLHFGWQTLEVNNIWQLFNQPRRVWFINLLILVFAGLASGVLLHNLISHASEAGEWLYLKSIMFYIYFGIEIVFVYVVLLRKPVSYWMIKGIETFLWLNAIALYFLPNFWIMGKYMFLLRALATFLEFFILHHATPEEALEFP